MITCDYCSETAKKVNGLKIYPHRPDLKDLVFWMCEPCNAYVGTHKNSSDAKPLGRLANAELRKARNLAHAKFDPLWRSGAFRRSEAYLKLAKFIGIEPPKCHIAWFDIEKCKKVLEFCEALDMSF